MTLPTSVRMACMTGRNSAISAAAGVPGDSAALLAGVLVSAAASFMALPGGQTGEPPSAAAAAAVRGESWAQSRAPRAPRVAPQAGHAAHSALAPGADARSAHRAD